MHRETIESPLSRHPSISISAELLPSGMVFTPDLALPASTLEIFKGGKQVQDQHRRVSQQRRVDELNRIVWAVDARYVVPGEENGRNSSVCEAEVIAEAPGGEPSLGEREEHSLPFGGLCYMPGQPGVAHRRESCAGPHRVQVDHDPDVG